MTVHFENVGRDRLTWSAEVQSLDDATLVRQIRARGALMSREVEFIWNERGITATILVGGVRAVGGLTVQGGADV